MKAAVCVNRKEESALRRPGNDLLSQVLRHSTIGAEAFDGRVRDGIGSNHFARVTRPAKGRSKLVLSESDISDQASVFLIPDMLIPDC